MIKYYTRACNFYYGNQAQTLIKKKHAFPLCGNKNLAFDSVEIYTRKNNKVSSKIILIKEIKKLSKNQKKKTLSDLKKIISKRKNFLKFINFSSPSIMGILNLTPDSFSDGGKFNSKIKSLKQIDYLIKAGARIIDIGGESSRPGSKPVNEKTEWKRVNFIIKHFKKRYNKYCLSFDTRKTNLMVKGIKHGVDLINDVSGFEYDKYSLKKLQVYKISKVLHHMQGTPQTMQINPSYKNVLLDIYDFFEKKIKLNKGDKKFILDPGIGFGKTLKHNLTLITKISLFHSLGLPILVGTSRKRFIGQISGKFDSKERLGGTLASVIYLLMQGVQIFRVHNVSEVNQGMIVFKEFLSKK